MPKPVLVIANKRYSSWSLRPWIAMKASGIPFEEKQIFLRKPDSYKKLDKVSPGGKVPVLIDGKNTVWESLAILEYLAEKFPKKNLWPKDSSARTWARSISNEMHGGFTALRTHCNMNCVKLIKGFMVPDGALKDAARVEAIWNTTRKKFAKKGPFLFGSFTNADAMYAPVVTRFKTYGLPANTVSRAYMEVILELPAMKEWIHAAKQETEIIPDYEK